MGFLSLFSEFLVPQHRSLNFRALVLSAMIAAKKAPSQSDYAAVTEIASSIYGGDMRRSNALLQMARAHVAKVTSKKKRLDDLLLSIDKELQSVHRYAKKIDFSHLRRLMIESDEEDIVSQEQVYNYMLSEVKRYTVEENSSKLDFLNKKL